MKRTFRGVVQYIRREGNQGPGIDLGRPSSYTWPAWMDYREFQKILGVSCEEGQSGEMNLKLRLIGTPMPRNEWVWPAESQHPANRVVVQYVAKHFSFCRPAGRAWLTRCCAVEMKKIFPGLAETLREDCVCEVEITVEKDRTQTRGDRHATN